MTHVHTDHSLELPTICNKHKLKSNAYYNVFVPSTSVKHITLLERCISQLSFPESENQTDEEILQHQKIKINQINCGDIFIVNNYQIEVLESHHTIQAVGYGISTITKKLKSKHASMMMDEIVDKKERIKQIEKYFRDKKLDVNIWCQNNVINISIS